MSKPTSANRNDIENDKNTHTTNRRTKKREEMLDVW